jgi:putative addiction module killer protein
VGREISEYFGVMRRSQQLIVDFSPQGIRLPRDMFNPACEGPVGKVAASAFGRSVELMLASSILEDLLFDIAGDDSPLSRHIDPVFDTIKAQSLRTLKAPWDVHTVPLVKNMQLLADLWISGELLTKTVERVMASPKYLLEHDFRMTVEDMNYALMTKEAKRQSAIAGQASQNPSDERPNPNQTHTTATLTEKQKFFRALQGASPKALDARAFADEHRALYSSYKRGHASLTECLDLVRNGATQLPASSEQWSDTLAVPSTPPPSGPTMGKQKALESPPARHEAEEAERYEIVGYDSKWFQGWLNSLPQHERRLIAKRLDSARDGHFGDYVQLRGNRWLFEFRFHLGDGKRVFFSFDGDTKIVLHAAGSKKEQSRLIETAIKHRGS